MKLATLRDGSRDGHLVVVSRDGTLAHHASGIASRLSQVLDDWGYLSPQLEDLSATLNLGKARHAFPFEPSRCMAVLPRGPGIARWQAGGAVLPAEPGAERPIGGREPRPVDASVAQAAWALVTGDIPAGSGAGACLDGVRLLSLAVDWLATPRGEGDGGPAPPWVALATTLGPVAVTPDELGEDWRFGQLRRPMRWVRGDGVAVPMPVTVDFGAALARCAAHRPVPAGFVLLGWAEAPSQLPPSGVGRVEWTDAQGSAPLGSVEDLPPPMAR